MNPENKIQPEDDFLKNLPKDNPYRVPEGYFEELTGSVLFRISGAEEQKPEQDIQKVFEVPPAYFESLSSRVLQKVSSQPKKQGKLLTLIVYKRIAVAAVILLAFGLAMRLSKKEVNPTNTIVNLEQVSDDEIIS